MFAETNHHHTRAEYGSTKVTADIYAHMIKSSDREAANALDSVLG